MYFFWSRKKNCFKFIFSTIVAKAARSTTVLAYKNIRNLSVDFVFLFPFGLVFKNAMGTEHPPQGSRFGTVKDDVLRVRKSKFF